MTSPPPHDLTAEAAFLGCVLLSGGACLDDMGEIAAEDFYAPAHGTILTAMQHLREQGQPADLVTVSGQLRAMRRLDAVGGYAVVAALQDAVASASHAEAYARRVRDLATLRRLIRVCQEQVVRAMECSGPVAEVIDQTEAAVLAVAGQTRRREAVVLRDAIGEVFTAMQEAAARGDTITGVPTGLYPLDRLLGGLQFSDLVLVAGRPSMGKTSLAMQFALTACRVGGAHVASLEMSTPQLVRRLLASEARVDGTRLRTGQVTSDDMDRLMDHASRVAPYPLWIDDTPAQSVFEIRAGARRTAKRCDALGTQLALVVVDYLQLMRGRGKGQSREQEVAEMSRGLKALAKELNVPVVALSQLSRSCESRTDKRPVMADLRESGQLEQDADAILFVYRGEMYDRDDASLAGVAEIIIGKQRNGPVGTVSCRFFHEFTRFEALAADGAGYGGQYDH